VIDVEQECARLTGELTRLDQELVKLRQRLQSEGFLARAPEHVVEADRAKEREWSVRADQLRHRARALCGS
jgi:valyl-tRNA synthetase